MERAVLFLSDGIENFHELIMTDTFFLIVSDDHRLDFCFLSNFFKLLLKFIYFLLESIVLNDLRLEL